MLESLKDAVQENTQLLNILIGRTTHRDSSYDELVTLHITDMNKFVEFESSLEDKLKRKLMVTIYKCIASEISFYISCADYYTQQKSHSVILCVYVYMCVYIYIYIYIYIFYCVSR